VRPIGFLLKIQDAKRTGTFASESGGNLAQTGNGVSLSFQRRRHFAPPHWRRLPADVQTPVRLSPLRPQDVRAGSIAPSDLDGLPEGKINHFGTEEGRQGNPAGEGWSGYIRD
jgi:hypothetical protein